LGILTWFAAAACIAGASPGKDSFQEGLSALKAGQYAEAIGAFSLAIEAVPHGYEALNNENGKPYRQTHAVRPGGRPEDVRVKIAALDGLIGFSPEGSLSTRGPKEQVVRTPPGIPVSIDLMRDAPEHATWDVIMESVPLNGTLSGILPHLIYTPNPGFGGEDLFDYRLSDGSQSTHPIRVRIIVGLTEGAMPDEPGNAETVRSSAVHPEAVDPPLEEAPGADANPPAGEPAPAAEAADAQWLGSPAPEVASSTIQTPDAAEVEAAAPVPETPFAVQVQSLRQREAAEQVVRELNRAGHAAFHRIAAIPGRGNWHRVYVGPFATFEEAEQAKRRLSGGPLENAFVARLGRNPGPPLRITGPEGAGDPRNPYAFQVRSCTR
jgi:cell division septation protein DedD